MTTTAPRPHETSPTGLSAAPAATAADQSTAACLIERGRSIPAAPASATAPAMRTGFVHRVPLAMGAALVVAAIAGLGAATLAPVHRAGTSAVVLPGAAGDTSEPESAARVAAAYVAAAGEPTVLAAAAQGTGWSGAEAADNIAVTEGSVPGVIAVTITTSGPGASTAQARQVAAAVPAALESAVLAAHTAAVQVWTDRLNDQLAEVRADYSAAAPGSANAARADADVVLRLQQLSAISRAQPPLLVDTAAATALPDDPRRPLAVAALAFVLTAAAVLALAALRGRRTGSVAHQRGRRGRTLTRAAGARLAREGQAAYLEAPHDPLGSAVLLPLRGDVGRGLAAGRQVVVLVGPGLTRGEAAALVAPAEPAPEHLVVVMLDQPWWRYVDAARVAQVVVVATEGSAALEQVEQAAAAAAGMGAPAHVVLLTQTSPPGSPQAASAGTARVDADAQTPASTAASAGTGTGIDTGER